MCTLLLMPSHLSINVDRECVLISSCGLPFCAFYVPCMNSPSPISMFVHLTFLYRYYREIDGAIIVYDMTKQSTFSAVDIWLSDLRKYADPDIVTMLVGNKCDEEQQAVSTVEARTYSKTNSMLFYETSAKNSTNVDDAFYAFVQGQ